MTAEDLFNILLEEQPSISLREREEEVFELIPELRECKGFNQHSIWHPYDVYEHILHVVDNVPNNLLLRVAALFHDVGKPRTLSLDEEGNGHFPFHWGESQRIFLEFVKRNNLPKQFEVPISYLIFFHDLRGKNLPDSLVFMFGEEGIKNLYELKRADLLAQSEAFHYLLDDYNKQEQNVLSRCTH
ncbi:MAG: HD domain-containing protein [Bacilli bacterium]|nr:HD domain-containing protein [Bacilli bacterium]